MNLLFNTLLINEMTNRSKIGNNEEKLLSIYNNLHKRTKNLKKFPALYVKFYQNFNDLLIKDRSTLKLLQVDQIVKNLINISTVRKLTEEEEK